ncbi:MAG TPA: DUF5715 family protein, partial [Blastocatellia bacterium]|nr:DUF5715 family protein [Blastocatellia bacterium]
RRATIASYYRNAEKRKLIEHEIATLQELASDFNGESYDLTDPAARRKMKVRLLSFLRLEAKNVLLELSRSYNEKFSRPLPVTSLVRPEQYQRLLGETNPNATRVEAPPHSTGLAFDVYYYYMTGPEQDFLMAEVARMEEEGRVEALRENRNHIHIFAFADGKQPEEQLIAQTIKQLGSRQTSIKTARGSRKTRTTPARHAVAKDNKNRSDG